jgi:PAS domain S-box-containing protein
MMDDLPLLLQPDVRAALAPLFEALGEGVLVCDPDARVVACNGAAQRILGLPAARLEGQRLTDLALRVTREDGTPLAAGAHPVRAALDGDERAGKLVLTVAREGAEPVWIELACRPLAASGGGVAAVVCTFADITPLRQAEALLRDTVVRNRTLAEAIAQSGSSVVITDRLGRIEYANPACCKAYGYSEAELIGANPRLFKSGETPSAVYEMLWKSLLAGRTWRGELSNRARDGRIIRETMSVSPVHDEDGQLRHFVALKEDITQLREDERRRHELFERLARLERMEVIATLAGGVAHDFNNVLVAILGYSELAENLLREDGGLPRVTGFIEEIRIAGERARDLVQQLLSVSRGAAGRPRSTSLIDATREVVGLLQATLSDTIALVSEVELALPPLSVDPGHIHQILMNLLINARDAIRGAGTIRLSVGRVTIDAGRCDSCRREFADDFLALTVSDDGSGIDEALRARIFEPFFTTKDLGRGTGMGLAVVHGLAHFYDGHLRVHSTPGAGTAIEVLLPRALLGSVVMGRR